jgi:hypothetical protein
MIVRTPAEYLDNEAEIKKYQEVAKYTSGNCSFGLG